jgi:hypothetical protein
MFSMTSAIGVAGVACRFTISDSAKSGRVGLIWHSLRLDFLSRVFRCTPLFICIVVASRVTLVRVGFEKSLKRCELCSGDKSRSKM